MCMDVCTGWPWCENEASVFVSLLCDVCACECVLCSSACLCVHCPPTCEMWGLCVFLPVVCVLFPSTYEMGGHVLCVPVHACALLSVCIMHATSHAVPGPVQMMLLALGPLTHPRHLWDCRHLSSAGITHVTANAVPSCRYSYWLPPATGPKHPRLVCERGTWQPGMGQGGAGAADCPWTG